MSLPSLQLFRIIYLREESAVRRVGSIRFFVRFTDEKSAEAIKVLRCGMQEGPREKLAKSRVGLTIYPLLILFLSEKVFRNSSQLLLLTSILMSLHLALKIVLRSLSNS